MQSISGSNSFYNLISSGSVVTLQSDLNILNNLTVSSISTFDFNSRIVTISGDTDINGTLTANTGFFDANGAFDATGGTVQFTATGNLKLGSTVTSLGTFTRATSKVTYDGSSPQNIYNANYYDLSINNSSGTNLIAGTSLSGNLDLSQGIINHNTHTLSLATVTNASNSSHTHNGHVFKHFDSTSPFTCPVGDGTNYRPITLTSSTTNTNSLSAAYMFAAQNQSSLNSSLSSIETYGWDIQRFFGSDGFNITIPFDASYSITDFNNLTIAMWNGTEWTEVPSTVTGTASSGSITTNSPVSDFSNRYFALGYKSIPKTTCQTIILRLI